MFNSVIKSNDQNVVAKLQENARAAKLRKKPIFKKRQQKNDK